MRQIISPLDGFRSPFGRLMGSTAPFTPAVLFGASEPGVWYDPSDLTTLFQDTAGTTPVTTPGQTVALALDKSKGLVLGSEQIVNGSFNDASWWGLDAGWAITGGAAVNTAASQMYTPLGFIEVGKTYLISFDVSATTTSGNFIVVVGASNITIPSVSGTGRYTLRASDATGGRLRFGSGSGHNWRGSLDNVTVKELPGFHATQATLASRPTYGIVPLGGRRNLLTFTEQFDNAAWVKTGSTVSANTSASPIGGLTADTLVESAAGGEHFTSQQLSKAAASLTYTYTAYFKAGSGSRNFGLGITDGTTGGYAAIFSTSGSVVASSQVVGSVTGWTFISSSVSADLGGGWYRASLIVSTNTAARVDAVCYLVDGTNRVYTGNGTSSVLVWGAQLETGSSATAYQRVGSAFDVTEAGVASLSYLFFEISDFLQTPAINFTGTDAMTVWAGLRKNSDTARGTVVELTASAAANNGAFHLTAPNAASATYAFESKGTTLTDAVATGVTAPITSVLCGYSDISLDQNILRVNGVQADSDTGDQGTGTFSNAIMYIGMRAGTSLPANMQLYSLIVRGAATDVSTIGQGETWVNGKTGAYA